MSENKSDAPDPHKNQGTVNPDDLKSGIEITGDEVKRVYDKTSLDEAVNKKLVETTPRDITDMTDEELAILGLQRRSPSTAETESEDKEKTSRFSMRQKVGALVLAAVTGVGTVLGITKPWQSDEVQAAPNPQSTNSAPVTPGGGTSAEASASPSEASSASPSETIVAQASDIEEAAKYFGRSQTRFIETGRADQQLGTDGNMWEQNLSGDTEGAGEGSIFNQKPFDLTTNETIGQKSPVLAAIYRTLDGRGDLTPQQIRDELGAQGIADQVVYQRATMFGQYKDGDIDVLDQDRGSNAIAGYAYDLNGKEAKKQRALVNNQTNTEPYGAKDRWIADSLSDDVMTAKYKGEELGVVVLNYDDVEGKQHIVLTPYVSEFTGPDPTDSSKLITVQITKFLEVDKGKGYVDVNQVPELPQE